MNENYNRKMVYRVWYGLGGGIEKEAFFTDKESAKKFSEEVNGSMNVWRWEMWIEK